MDTATLATAWRQTSTMQRIDKNLLPKDRTEAYRLRDSALDTLGWALGGWKIGAMSSEIQAAEGYDGPMPGRILRDRILPSGAHIPTKDCRNCKIEFELAFHLKQDISSAADLVGREQEFTTSLLAYDIVRSCYDPQWLDSIDKQNRMLAQLADNGNSGFVITGQPLDRAASSAPLTLDIQLNDKTVQTAAVSIGQAPYAALSWLATHALDCGSLLRKGDLVLTGSLTTPILVKEGDTLTTDFSSQQQLVVNFY